MGRRKTFELDRTFAANVPMLAAMIERIGEHSISPRFDDDEDIVGYSAYHGERLLRGFHTLSQARRWVRALQRTAPPAPPHHSHKFRSDEFVQSFAA